MALAVTRSILQKTVDVFERAILYREVRNGRDDGECAVADVLEREMREAEIAGAAQQPEGACPLFVAGAIALYQSRHGFAGFAVYAANANVEPLGATGAHVDRILDVVGA